MNEQTKILTAIIFFGIFGLYFSAYSSFSTSICIKQAAAQRTQQDCHNELDCTARYVTSVQMLNHLIAQGSCMQEDPQKQRYCWEISRGLFEDCDERDTAYCKFAQDIRQLCPAAAKALGQEARVHHFLNIATQITKDVRPCIEISKSCSSTFGFPLEAEKKVRKLSQVINQLAFSECAIYRNQAALLAATVFDKVKSGTDPTLTAEDLLLYVFKASSQTARLKQKLKPGKYYEQGELVEGEKLTSSFYFSESGEISLFFDQMQGDDIRYRLKPFASGTFKEVFYALNLQKNELQVRADIKANSEEANFEEEEEKARSEHDLINLFEGTSGVQKTSAFFKRTKESASILQPFYEQSFSELVKNIRSNQNQGPLTKRIQIQASIASKLVDSIKEIHGKNLLHRDIKPENILVSFNPVTHQPEVHVADFGLALQLNRKENEPNLTPFALPFQGTYDYFSPELMRGESDSSTLRKKLRLENRRLKDESKGDQVISEDEIEKRVKKFQDQINAAPSNDVWALGMTLYQMLHDVRLNADWDPSSIFSYHDLKTSSLKINYVDSPPSQGTLDYVIYRMLDPDSSKRITLDEASELLSQIRSESSPRNRSKTSPKSAPYQ